MLRYLNSSEQYYLKHNLFEFIHYKTMLKKGLLDPNESRIYMISFLSDLKLISKKYNLLDLNTNISDSLLKNLFKCKCDIIKTKTISIYDFILGVLSYNHIEFEERALSDDFADYCIDKFYFYEHRYWGIDQNSTFDEILNVLLNEKIQCGFIYSENSEEFEESNIDLENMILEELHGAFKNGFSEVVGDDYNIINIHKNNINIHLQDKSKEIFENFFESTKVLNFNSISYSENTINMCLENVYHYNNPDIIYFLILILLILNN